MMKLDKSSRGFSLFTPLVGTALVIMAILIATGMIQNDVRISRTLTASYEVSSQSILSKLIKATAEVQMLTNMETITYDEVARAFECSDSSSCDSEISGRMMDKNVVPSVYSDLVEGIFANLVDSIDTVLLGSGTNYRSVETAFELQTRFGNLIRGLSNPFSLGKSDGKYYIKINSEKFKLEDFVLEFRDATTGDSMKVSIAPYGFNFTTAEPLYDLITAEKEVFSDSTSFDSKDNAKSKLEEQFDGDDGLAHYVVNAWFNNDSSNRRLKMEFSKGGESTQTFNVTFETKYFATDDFDIHCSYSKDYGFGC